MVRLKLSIITFSYLIISTYWRHIIKVSAHHLLSRSYLSDLSVLLRLNLHDCLELLLRRPMLVLALILTALILTGKKPGSSDREGKAYAAADGRRLEVSGTVVSRECTAKGYRIIMDHLVFEAPDSYSSSIYRSIIQTLNAAVRSGDRIQIFLSNGQTENITMYGEGQEASFWSDSKASADQTELFMKIRIGDRVRFHGKCSQPEQASNPGQFDSRSYYLARRIILKMSEADLRSREDSKENWLYSACHRYLDTLASIRIGMQMGLQYSFGIKDSSLIAASVLGDKSGLDAETLQLFRDGGLSWLICVSSLHMSLLGRALYHFLRKRGISFISASAVSGIVVISYALLTGFSISSQRALVTFLIWLGAEVSGRTRDTLTSLSCAALFILLRQPYALWDASFLLSFVCILSLEYLTPALERVIKPRYSIQKKICGSISIWIGSLPAVLWFFYQTAPFAGLVYLIVLPVMSLFLGLGITGSMAGYAALLTGSGFILQIGRLFAYPCHILLQVFQMVCSLEREIPGSVLILGRPAGWQMAVYYTTLVIFVLYIRSAGNETFRKRPEIARRGLNRTRAGSGAMLLALIWIICFRIDPDFSFLCLDIGQGSCNLIRSKGVTCLFDAGSSSVDHVWQYRIDSTLKYYGISRIDKVFLSHGDMDHINGVEQMLELYHRNLIGQNAGDVTIGQILLPDLPCTDDRLAPIIDEAGENGIPVDYVSAGQSFSFKDMSFDILDPSPDRITGNANEDCTVMLIRYQNLRIFCMGDLEKEGEEMFVKSWQDSYAGTWDMDPSCRVLIAGHHGSKNATSEALLNCIKPDIALISCGKNNRYGHPSAQVLNRLEMAEVPYRRTDQEGAILIMN